jgi:hypothetical protein
VVIDRHKCHERESANTNRTGPIIHILTKSKRRALNTKQRNALQKYTASREKSTHYFSINL